MKICIIIDYRNILHQLQMSEHRIFFLVHALAGKHLILPDKEKHTTETMSSYC